MVQLGNIDAVMFRSKNEHNDETSVSKGTERSLQHLDFVSLKVSFGGFSIA